jgi:hypothetical protein
LGYPLWVFLFSSAHPGSPKIDRRVTADPRPKMITGLDEYFSAQMRKPATKFKATGLIVNGEKL